MPGTALSELQLAFHAAVLGQQCDLTRFAAVLQTTMPFCADANERHRLIRIVWYAALHEHWNGTQQCAMEFMGYACMCVDLPTVLSQIATHANQISHLLITICTKGDLYDAPWVGQLFRNTVVRLHADRCCYVA